MLRLEQSSETALVHWLVPELERWSAHWLVPELERWSAHWLETSWGDALACESASLLGYASEQQLALLSER